MAALTSASWTVVITSQQLTGGPKPVRITRGTMALAGTDTYPDNGIPLPVIGTFGMKRNIDKLDIFGVDATAGTVADYVQQWDKTNHKLFLYEEEATAAGGPLLECDTSEVPGPRTYNWEAQGW